MLLNPSPRKVVPLSSGNDGPSRRPVPTLTKRAFYCGVVVEGPNDGADLSEDVQDLVASLGDKIPSAKDYDQPRAAPPTPAEKDIHTRPRALTNTSALADLINELIVTERTYVQRLRMLKNSYADPLRAYAKNKDTSILGQYDAKTLFGNIDNLVPANEAFLRDLEKMASASGAQKVGVGDVALRHFKDLQTFECYKLYYTKREEAQEIFKAEMSKKSSTGFAAFVERIKYSTSDVKNRVGLRELLMEPVQRIPRYTLLFQSMIKLMGANDPQRAKLAEAKDLASRIAMAEADSHTRLAATLSCLATSIEGFPPGLISSSRRFIDCIDVVDNLAEAAGMNPYGSQSFTMAGNSTPSNTSGFGASLQCTLFLFDDKLMIVKRPGNEKAGRSLSGLDDVDRVASGGLVSGKIRNMPSIKRSGMSFRGVVDITDVNATDVSSTDMHLYLESPPVDQTDRWAGRPFRVLSAALPGVANLDATRLEDEKRRFIENLWRAQARYRTRMGQSVALRADEQEVESRSGRVTIARTYFNVYQRTMFLQEAKKTKVVLHIDSLGDADPLPFGIDGPPFVIIRVRPLPGELCRYSVHSCDPSEEQDEDIVQSSRVPLRVIQTIHQYGLFKFKTDNPSRPATPSGPNRSRAHIFGLDVISRNLFGSKAKDSPSDSMGRHIRTKSALSRTATLVTESSGTMTTADSSTRFSQRTYSTAATSVSSFAVDDSSLGKRSSKSRKLSKRNTSRSPTPTHARGSDPLPEDESGNRSLSRRRARSLSVPRHEDSLEYSDLEDVDTTVLDAQAREKGKVTASDIALSKRLDLARRNSQNQPGGEPSRDTVGVPVEDVIYEDDPPPPTARRASRASQLSRTRSNSDYDAHSPHSTSHNTSRSITPTPAQEYGSPRRSRAESFRSSRDRRPIGPRAPSPLPPASPAIDAMEIDIEGALESTLARMTPDRPSTPEHVHLADGGFDEDEIVASSPVQEAPSRIPRGKHRPFAPVEAIRKDKHGKVEPKAPEIGPLTIKKKVLSGTATPATGVQSSPSTTSNTADGGNTPPTRQRSDPCLSVSERTSSEEPVSAQDLVQLRKRTRENLESSQRAVKRARLEISTIPSRIMQGSPRTSDFRTPAHVKLNHVAPVQNAPKTKEAIDRIQEMYAMIERRKGSATTPRTPRPNSIIEGPLSQQSPATGVSDIAEVQSWTRAVDELVSSAESDMSRAIDNYTKLEDAIARIIADHKQSNKDLDKALFSLERAKGQYRKLQEKLVTADAEIEAMYGEFNAELESLFKKVTLQQDEAWVATCADLSETKKERFRLSRENSDLRRRLREIEAQQDKWASLLRSHGLIS